MNIYAEHPDKPDRFHHVTPDVHTQLEMDISHDAMADRFDLWVQTVNEALREFSKERQAVWRMIKGVHSDGTTFEPLTMKFIADNWEAITGASRGRVSSQTVRSHYLEAEAHVQAEIARFALRLAGVRT